MKEEGFNDPYILILDHSGSLNAGFMLGILYGIPYKFRIFVGTANMSMTASGDDDNSFWSSYSVSSILVGSLQEVSHCIFIVSL